MLPIRRPAVSKHLALLTHAGLVRHESQGTRNLYSPGEAGFNVARHWLDGFWDDAMGRYKLVAENTPPGACNE